MKLRRRYVPLIVVLGIASAVLPAIASSETSPTVDAVNTGIYEHAWSPSQVAVMAGGVVTFRNTSTEVRHGVEWVGGPAKPTCEPGVPVGTTEAASGTSWSGTCMFAQPGTYTFYCTVHGPEMTGTVTVSSSGTTTTTMTTTGGSPTTTGATPPPNREAPTGPPPVSDLSLRASQHGTVVRGSLEISQAAAGGRLEVDLLLPSTTFAKLKHATLVSVGRLTHASVPAGRQAFSIKLNAKAKRALERRGRLALTVKITLTPRSGKPTTLTRAVVEHLK